MPQANNSTGDYADYSFIQKVWIVLGSIALLAITIFLLRATFGVMLMVLAGCLIATYFHGLGDMIQRWSRWNRKVCMMISVLLTLIIITLLCWFLGTKISAQASALSNDLPRMANHVEQQMQQSNIGRQILENVSGKDSQKLSATVQSFFRTSFGVIGDLYIITFLGIFFTASPSLYKTGIITLIPERGKEKTRLILDRISRTFKLWLKGLMITILLVAFISGTGLTIIGVPMALALAVFAALLSFVPNFGPVIAMAPAVLIALTISFNTGVAVAILYIAMQTLANNIVTPLVQKRMIDLPPALTLVSQLIMGAISGVLGIILATPLLAIISIIVDELYVKMQAAAALNDAAEAEKPLADVQ